jgi:hypothetical protein
MPWETISEAGSFCLPEGHPLAADPFLGSLRGLMKRNITGEIVAMRGVKFQLALKIRFRKERNDGGEVVAQPIFYSRQQASLRAIDRDAALTETTEKIQMVIEEYTWDWAVDRVVELYIINIARYQPFHGGSCIDLPVAIKSRKAVNIKNNDDHYLRWSILASRYPADKNPQRPSKYRDYWDTLDLSGVDSPTPLTKIK